MKIPNYSKSEPKDSCESDCKRYHPASGKCRLFDVLLKMPGMNNCPERKSKRSGIISDASTTSRKFTKASKD